MSRNSTTIDAVPEGIENEPTASSANAKDATVLFDDYLDRVYSYVSRRVGSPELAEDVTAETFRAALECFGKLKHQDPYLWLLGIAKRKVADAYRDQRKRAAISFGANRVEVAGPDDERPDRTALAMERAAELRRLVMRLPEDQREALLLQHLEQLSQESIAQVMRKSPAAVNSLQQRARANILKWGAGYFDESDLGGNL